MNQVVMFVSALIIAVLATTSWRAYNHGNEQLDSVKNQLPFSQIQWDMTQLEGAIEYQQEHEWSVPSHVREKVGDVMQDIMVIREVTFPIGLLSDQERIYLEDLYNRLSDYPRDNMVEPVNEITPAEIEQFDKLRAALIKVKWDGSGNRADWESFMDKLLKLLPLI